MNNVIKVQTSLRACGCWHAIAMRGGSRFSGIVDSVF
jgi:hypothetical protein